MRNKVGLSLVIAAFILASSAAIPTPAEAHMAIHCKPETGRRQADPIVTNDAPVPSSHLHTYLGNTVLADMVNPNNAVYSDLVGKATTCSNVADSAAYWFPTVSRGGVPLSIAGQTNYYRDFDNDQEDKDSPVRAYPKDARFVAGNGGSVNPQPAYIVSWGCGELSGRNGAYPDPVAAACHTATGTKVHLAMNVRYPPCWDGASNSHVTGNTADFSGTHAIRQHYAYGLQADGDPHSYLGVTRCPSNYPIEVPALNMVQRFDYQGDGTDISISSGDIHSVHADFWNTWVQTKLTRAINRCIKTTVTDHPHGFPEDCGPDPNGDRV